VCFHLEDFAERGGTAFLVEAYSKTHKKNCVKAHALRFIENGGCAGIIFHIYFFIFYVNFCALFECRKSSLIYGRRK
jgi:hypothetical protein